MKAFYNQKPSRSAYLLPSGDVAVCIDWAEKQVLRGSVTVNGYECTRVDVSADSLSADAVIEMFVRERYTQSEEFALINAYQASVAKIEVNADKEAEYLNFLVWRKDMKEQVKAAVSAYGSELINEETEGEVC